MKEVRQSLDIVNLSRSLSVVLKIPNNIGIYGAIRWTFGLIIKRILRPDFIEKEDQFRGP